MITSVAHEFPRGKPRARRAALGLPFLLILAYLFIEYVRPANPLKIPLILSLLLFAAWLRLPKKEWSPQVIAFFALLALIGLMGPIAKNNYAIFLGFQTLAIQLLCIAVPIAHFVRPMRKVSLFIQVLVSIYAYVAVYSFFHGGRGPGGHLGDQNDLALALNMVIPVTFALFLGAEVKTQKVLYAGAFAVMVAGVIGSSSRSGFVGMAAVLLYCISLSGRWITAGLTAVGLCAGLWMLSPESYWLEIWTIADALGPAEPGAGELRWEYWQIAWRMFLDNPIFGVGYENFGYNATSYQTQEQWQHLERALGGVAAHSIYFSVLAEMGIAGALLFGAIVWQNFKDTGFILRSAREEEATSGATKELDRARHYALGIRGAMIGFLVSGAFLSVFGYPHFWVITALTVALRGVTGDALVRANAVTERGGQPSVPLSEPQRP